MYTVISEEWQIKMSVEENDTETQWSTICFSIERYLIYRWRILILPQPGVRPTNDISIKIGSALVSNILNRSQRNFAHVTTVTLSWRVQNFVVVGRAHFKLEYCKFWSNFEFDRNIVSGTGARSASLRAWIVSTSFSAVRTSRVPVELAYRWHRTGRTKSLKSSAS